jgi:hypothetical protein
MAKAPTGKFVKITYTHHGEHIYAVKARKSFQMTFIGLVLAKFGTKGSVRIDLDTLKELRADAERKHHNREWDGKMYNGAKGTLCQPLFAHAEQSGYAGKVTAAEVNLEGLDIFARTGLDPYNYGFFSRKEIEFLDAIPAGFVKDTMPGAKGWTTPARLAQCQESSRKMKLEFDKHIEAIRNGTAY